jgi:hypothetical protein
MKSNTTHMPKLDLFLDANRQQIKDFSHILGKDIGLRDRRQTKGLRMLLCNLYIQGQRQIRVSRRKESPGGKRSNPLSIGYKTIISSLDALQKNGYIIQIIGSHNEGTMTTMEPTDKLVQWFKDTEWSDDRIDKRVGSYVTLREARKQNNNAVYIDFEDTKYSKWLGERIREYDQLLGGCKIVLLNNDGLEDRVFSKFTIPEPILVCHGAQEVPAYFLRFRISADLENISTNDKSAQIASFSISLAYPVVATPSTFMFFTPFNSKLFFKSLNKYLISSKGFP